MDQENASFFDGHDHEFWNSMEKKRPLALVVGISLVTLAPLIVIGNVLIIIVIWKDPLRTLRSFTSSRILFSMAIADVLVGSILCPLLADWSLLIGVGDQPTFSVSVPLAINAVLSSVSVGHVLLLTLDRLFALFAPLQYRVKVTNKRVSIATILIWGYALVLGVLHAALLDLFIIFSVSRKADQIQRQWSLFSVANTAIKGDFETIALVPNKGLLIQEGNSNSLLLQ